MTYRLEVERAVDAEFGGVERHLVFHVRGLQVRSLEAGPGSLPMALHAVRSVTYDGSARREYLLPVCRPIRKHAGHFDGQRLGGANVTGIVENNVHGGAVRRGHGIEPPVVVRRHVGRRPHLETIEIPGNGEGFDLDGAVVEGGSRKILSL